MCIKKAICIASVGVMSSLCAMGNFPETDYEPGERAEIRKKNCEQMLISELNIDENDKHLLDILTDNCEKYACPDPDELLQRLAYFAQSDVIEFIINGDKQLPKELDILLCQVFRFHSKCSDIADDFRDDNDIKKAEYYWNLGDLVEGKTWDLLDLYKKKNQTIRSSFLEKAIEILKSHGYEHGFIDSIITCRQ